MSAYINVKFGMAFCLVAMIEVKKVIEKIPGGSEFSRIEGEPCKYFRGCV